LLEGDKVTLKLVEKEDLPIIVEWANNPDFFGQYDILMQISKEDGEKFYDSPNRGKYFFIQKKDGTKVGTIRSWDVVPGGSVNFGVEIGYALVSNERGKGYGTEAVNLLLDYSFLSSAITRIQAHTDTRNLPSQRVLEKTGFKKEGITRKGYFSRGELRDNFIYSILREEWKSPRLLKGATPA
jgi:RimJ/RimL family protein N-acetyltransferase